jgi:Protein of unknown function (DUF551)
MKRKQPGLDDGPTLPSPQALERAYRRIEANTPSPCPFCGTGSKIHPVNAEACSRFEWRPIETAPNEGRMVLLFAIVDSATGNWSMRIGSRWRGGDQWNGWGNSWIEPTHWMPLPTIPK